MEHRLIKLHGEVKGKGMDKAPHHYRKSCAIWDHTVLPLTRQRRLSPFTPAEAGTRFSDPEGCEAQLIWVVVRSEDGLPAKGSHLSQK